MAAWLPVDEGRSERPRPVAFVPDEDLVLARAFEVVAWGTVDGIPWQIDAYLIEPGPDAKWWEHGPVGPGLQFMLGRDGAFGGGGVGTLLNDGTHLTASISFFGSLPAIVSWVGVVSDRVARLVVRPREADEREIEIHDGPAGFPRLFWFFPPRGADGSVVALADDGTVLQTERLMDVDVPARANSGTSVNAFGYRADRPPLGWPPDDTLYGPGEGPRHEEDFHLHEVTFPLYAISPDRWDGYAGLAGSSASGREVTGVGFGYFDEPGGSRRGLEIVNARPDPRPCVRPVRRQDVGIWWSDPFTEDDDVNFAFRFVPRQAQASLSGEHGPQLGPWRVAAIGDLDAAGSRVEAHRREFRLLPAFRSIGFELPNVRVLMQGWDLSFEDLEGFARVLEPLELGNELFLALKDAQARSDRRFERLHGHHHEDG